MTDDYRLIVEYTADRYWRDPDFDRKLEKMARVLSSGSGMGFGIRDVDFVFKTKKGALNTYARLPRLRNVKVILYSPNGEVMKQKGKVI
jgi:hypothetical protein